MKEFFMIRLRKKQVCLLGFNLIMLSLTLFAPQPNETKATSFKKVTPQSSGTPEQKKPTPVSAQQESSGQVGAQDKKDIVYSVSCQNGMVRVTSKNDSQFKEFVFRLDEAKALLAPERRMILSVLSASDQRLLFKKAVFVSTFLNKDEKDQLREWIRSSKAFQDYLNARPSEKRFLRLSGVSYETGFWGTIGEVLQYCFGAGLICYQIKSFFGGSTQIALGSQSATNYRHDVLIEELQKFNLSFERPDVEQAPGGGGEATANIYKEKFKALLEIRNRKNHGLVNVVLDGRVKDSDSNETAVAKLVYALVENEFKLQQNHVGEGIEKKRIILTLDDGLQQKISKLKNLCLGSQKQQIDKCLAAMGVPLDQNVPEKRTGRWARVKSTAAGACAVPVKFLRTVGNGAESVCDRLWYGASDKVFQQKEHEFKICLLEILKNRLIHGVTHNINPLNPADKQSKENPLNPEGQQPDTLPVTDSL